MDVPGFEVDAPVPEGVELENENALAEDVGFENENPADA